MDSKRWTGKFSAVLPKSANGDSSERLLLRRNQNIIGSATSTHAGNSENLVLLLLLRGILVHVSYILCLRKQRAAKRINKRNERIGTS